MRILPAIALLCALVVAAPAFAEEHAAEPGKEESKEPKKEQAKKGKHEPGTTVEMPFLIAPVNINGRLEGYAYISAKIITSSLTAAVGVREKTPFFQDAFIRDVNAAPIGKADDPMTVDQPALVARLLADAKRIAGPGKVVSYVITQIQVAPVRPKQS